MFEIFALDWWLRINLKYRILDTLRLVIVDCNTIVSMKLPQRVAFCRIVSHCVVAFHPNFGKCLFICFGVSVNLFLQLIATLSNRIANLLQTLIDFRAMTLKTNRPLFFTTFNMDVI